MPCWLARTTTVNLENADPVTLLRALQDLGYRLNYGPDTMDAEEARRLLRPVYDGHKLTLPGEADVNVVKRAYSQRVVAETASRFGWRLKQQGQKATATRRS